MTWKIESMCIACHGPILAVNASGKASAPIACDENCRGYYYRNLRHGKPISMRYANLRAAHAYRREMMALERRLEAMVDGALTSHRRGQLLAWGA